MLAFVASNHPLARKPKPSLSELMDTPVIIKDAGRDGPQRVLDNLKKQGFSPKVAMRCDSQDAVKAAVRAGTGLGIMHEDMVRLDLRRGDFKTLNLAGQNLEVKSFIVYLRDRELPANARKFVALLHQWRIRN